jgi:hypothetical protein
MTVIDITGFSSHGAAPRGSTARPGFGDLLMRIVQGLFGKAHGKGRLVKSLGSAPVAVWHPRSASVAAPPAPPGRVAAGATASQQAAIDKEQELMKRFQTLADCLAAQYAASAKPQGKAAEVRQAPAAPRHRTG